MTGIGPAAVALISIGIVTTALIGVILPVGLTLKDSLPPPRTLSFERAFSPNQAFQFHACGQCNNSWDFASNERELSNELFSQQNPNVPDARGLSSLVAFMGQFYDHDIVLSVSDPSMGHFPIEMVPYNDTAPINATRNKVRIVNGCRESQTVNSPEIDASTVYGDYLRPNMLHLLRKDYGRSCKMRMSEGNLMPFWEGHHNQFLAGDERSTEHSILASLHTLWVREHNRMCDLIEARKGDVWTQEQMFWKARQIVIAKLQHICYNEWLPALFGSQTSLLSTVTPRSADTRISMEFSVVAFRFGHTMIPDPIGPFSLPSIFFNASMLVDYGIEAFFEAAYETQAQAVDSHVVDGLRNFLFAAGPMQIGEDLVTRNMFRARELGIGNYASVANCYRIPTQNTAEELYIAMLQEPIEAGSSLPKTIATIVAEQFKRLRMYDPNFYTKRANEIGSYFYAEVLNTTMASVLRANTNLQNVPDQPFFVVA